MATIKDIALETGYSISTVSRVLKQDKSFTVSDDTRYKIVSTAEKLQYVVKKPIQNTEEQVEKKKIALIYWYNTSEEVSDPYYLALRIVIESAAQNKNIEITKVIHNQVTNGVNILTDFDGFILLGKFSEEEILKYKAVNPIMIVVDCYSDLYDVDVVISNLKYATKEMIQYYIDHGVEHIGLLCGVEHTLDGTVLEDLRVLTYEKEMSKRNLYKEENVYLGDFSADYGYTMMSQIIKENKLQRAYILGSDAISIGCLRALNEHSIQVPESVSLLSFDNISLSQFTVPSLSTVDMNVKVMGESTIDLILEHIESQRTIGKKMIIPTKLIIRESSIK